MSSTLHGDEGSSVPATISVPRRAAVLGSPIAHSRSPQVHLAAYRALGLSQWTYDRIECTEEELPGLIARFGPEWVGVSVTMPGKFAALRCADEATERAQLVGSANTLVRTSTGWRADNTDVDGIVGALERVDGPAAVVGSGGTAHAAIVAFAALGVTELQIVARDRERCAPLLALAGRTGLEARWLELGAPVRGVSAVVSTIPADVAAAHAASIADTPVLLDAIYDPWPTPLAAAVEAAGGRTISGLQMLLNQAFAQVEQFTGMPAPKSAMRAALLRS